MADPGFVPALIGEIVRLAIVEAGKVVMCREYCRELAEMVNSYVKPVVAELGSLASDNPQLKSVADNWLASLRASLEEAEAVIIECRSVHSFNVFVKYRLSRRILSIVVKIKELHEAATAWNVALSAKAVTQCAEVLRRLQDNYRYVSLSAKTCNCTQSESYSKDRAIFEIANEATAYSAGKLDVVDEHDAELQSIPKLVFGLEELSSRLETALREGTRQWVGVWGKRGSGKTLLTQTVSNSLSVNNHFGGAVYWLTVARSPNITELQSRLGKRIGCGEQFFSSKEVGKGTLINYLKDTKALLILDDVWDGNVLQWFDVVDAPASKILVTSRNNSVFDKVPSTVIEVKLLSDEHSWSLFCSCAFPGQDRQQLEHNMEPRLAETVKKVVSECKGLPLALKVIGGFMAGKQQLGDWDSVLGSLRNAEAVSEEQEKLYIRLKLSYDELELIDGARGRRLQECFLYFAAFPEDAVIEVEQLIGYWIGEGLIRYKEDEDPQVEAYYILGQLIGRSLVDLEVGWTHSQSTKFLSCKIHDVLRDLAIYILENQKEATEYACLFLSGRGFPAGLCKGPGQKKFNAKKLSLIGNQVEKVDKLRIRAPDVEVLLLSNNSQLKHLTGRFLWSFKNLRVLDLSRTALTSLPIEIGKLKELVILDISYSSIQSVPDSIGRLTKLEHLNMQNCRLKSFPAQKVSKLINLRYLNARRCGDIWDQNQHDPCSCVASELPVQGLKNLAALQKLTRLWISSKTTERLPAMPYSTRLVHLSLYFENLLVIPDELQSLAALEVLDVNTCRSLQKLPNYLSKSFLGLLVLDLRCCTSLLHLPSDLQQLEWLQKLDLEGCQSLQSLPDAFGSSGAFHSLQELFMTGCNKLEAFPEMQAGALPRLRVLKLAFCDRLQHLRILPKALPNLVCLNLSGCAGLKELPDEEVFGHFTYLEELLLNNTRISSLPAGIGLLPRLKRLELKQCKELKALPPWVDRSGDYFINLEEVSLRGIPIREVPKFLAAAPQLRKMDLTDCDYINLTDEVLRLLKTRNVQLIGVDVQSMSTLNEAVVDHADKELPKQKPEPAESIPKTNLFSNADQHESASVLDPSSSTSILHQHSASCLKNSFLDWLARLIDETNTDEDSDDQKLAKDANSGDSGHARRIDMRDVKLELFKRGLEDHLVLGSCSSDVITEEVLRNLVCTSWNMRSYVGARFLANGFFELAFTDSVDVQRLLDKRFAEDDGRVILFQPFQQGFNPDEAGNLKAVWMGLPLLPTDCLHPNVFKAVGNALGSYLAYKLDDGMVPRVCSACTIQQEQELPNELELLLPSGKVWLQRLVRI